MRLSTVLDALRGIAPEALAEAWDKVGLQVGDPAQAVDAGLLCIDMTEAVVAEAVAKGCQLIVAYHPPLFAPLERLTDDGPWTQRRILQAVRAGVAVYSPHTALDAVRGGTNDWLCDGLGEASLRGSIGRRFLRNGRVKVIVYAPRAEAERLRRVMAEAGAGGIGRYRECSFNTEGTGTFLPRGEAKPAVGQIGALARVEETRIEMICESYALGEVLRAVREAHPYEEPAIDLLELADEPEPEDAEQGAGRVHFLDEPITPALLAQRVKQRLGVKQVKLAVPEPFSGKLQSIAVCVGSGGKLFEQCEADAYLTGEMQHHQVLDLVQRGKVVVLAGHTNTERPYLPTYRERLTDAAPAVRWEVSAADRVPLDWA